MFLIVLELFKCGNLYFCMYESGLSHPSCQIYVCRDVRCISVIFFNVCKVISNVCSNITCCILDIGSFFSYFPIFLDLLEVSQFYWSFWEQTSSLLKWFFFLFFCFQFYWFLLLSLLLPSFCLLWIYSALLFLGFKVWIIDLRLFLFSNLVL